MLIPQMKRGFELRQLEKSLALGIVVGKEISEKS